MMNSIKIICQCGYGTQHWCHVNWDIPEDEKKKYSRQDVLNALEWAMDFIPDYAWDLIEEGLDRVQ